MSTALTRTVPRRGARVARIAGMSRVLFVIAPRNFRDEELFETKAVLESHHHRCTIASETPGICEGARGRSVSATKAISAVDTRDYDAVVFVGGPGATVLFDDPAARHVARAMYDEGKTVAAICIAPTVLARAGLLRGKRATSFPSEENELVNGGAQFCERGVVVDGTIVTASGPSEAHAFGVALSRELRAPHEAST